MGFNLSIDCYGHYWDAESMGICAISDWQRMARLFSLIRDGYTQQMVLGTDVYIKILLRRFGCESYCGLTSSVVPSLELSGGTSEEIRQITIENPTRILAY